jgi:hypothetical protein
VEIRHAHPFGRRTPVVRLNLRRFTASLDNYRPLLPQIRAAEPLTIDRFVE